jgi:purine-cytosine permease-like protein
MYHKGHFVLQSNLTHADSFLQIAAIAGRNHLQLVMEDFLNVIAYWLTPFLAIMLLEHFCFRRGYAYDITAWNDPKKLPYNFAAFTVVCTGTVLAILCMSQVWYVGPIAFAVGNAPYGTDISWELALGATIMLYAPLRWLERRMTGFWLGCRRRQRVEFDVPRSKGLVSISRARGNLKSRW